MDTAAISKAREELRSLLREQSIQWGDFTLSSGAKSNHYFDCKLTTLDPRGAWLVGTLMHDLIRQKAAELSLNIAAVGGLTMGADPIALATSMVSFHLKDPSPLQTFAVRKTPKSHGRSRLIEGNFNRGDTVVVIDDVVTKGESTMRAIEAILAEGGRVGFVAALVDREEGGSGNITRMGHQVFAIFKKSELLVNRPPDPAMTARP